MTIGELLDHNANGLTEKETRTLCGMFNPYKEADDVPDLIAYRRAFAETCLELIHRQKDRDGGPEGLVETLDAIMKTQAEIAVGLQSRFQIPESEVEVALECYPSWIRERRRPTDDEF